MANEIQELKFQVGEAWKGVYSSSTAYGLANVVQDPTGLSIYRSLKSGNVGHPLSNASWWFRIIDLSSIKAESDRIAALNQSIAQDEALRVAAEELRQQHEAERVAAETQRDEAEQARISAEQQRVNKESQREAAEQQRISAEQGRVSAESARVQAEQARVLAETLRANAEDQRAANEQNRVAAEQQRIERAEQDHQRAESDHATYVDSLGAFDISSYHATDGVLAKYADLTAALGTGGANIPDDLRKGGMSVKFVQSSDNKYVQYRLMSDTFNTTVANWQGVDDEPVAGSENLVKSGGVNNATEFISSRIPKGFIKECYIEKHYSNYNLFRVDKNDDRYISGKTYHLFITKDSGDYIGHAMASEEDSYIVGSITDNGDTFPIIFVLDWSKMTDGIHNYMYSAPFNEVCYDLEFSPSIKENLNNTAVQQQLTSIVNNRNRVRDLIVLNNDFLVIPSEETLVSIGNVFNRVIANFKAIKRIEIAEQTHEANTLYCLTNLYGPDTEYPRHVQCYRYVLNQQTGQYERGTKVFEGNVSGNKFIANDFQDSTRKFTIWIDWDEVQGNQSLLMNFPLIIFSPKAFMDYEMQSSEVVGLRNDLTALTNFVDSSLEVVDEKIDELKEEIGFETEEQEKDYTTLTSVYLRGGTIRDFPNHDSSLIKIYQVRQGDIVTIKQPEGFLSASEAATNTYAAAGFVTLPPAAGNSYIPVLMGSTEAQELEWTAQQNGYLICWCRDGVSGSRVTGAYGVEEVWKYKDILDNLDPEEIANLVDKVYPLKGKTVCIMGDSIMQNMCTPNVPTNTTTFKDITEVDPTEYTESDITIVNGYIYLTSSLTGGEVTENSIRLKPINSGQAEIDHKRWYDLENKLRVADMFVTGMGGGRIVETTNKIITAYPARHTSGILNGLMEDLPNQVRQLLRVVNEGIHNAPDCVVIWMGVNGADTVITDTFDEAFAIEWDTLKDDHAGYEYRSKFYGAMRFAIESIYRAFPYCTIFIVSPSQNSRGDKKIDGSDYAYRGYHSLNNVSNAMREIAARYACVFVDALHEIGLANFSIQADTLLGENEVSTGTHLGNLVPTFLNNVQTDGLHPNAAGKILWANYLTTHLKSRYYPKKDS